MSNDNEQVIDLHRMVLDKIEDLGHEDAAKYFGRTVATIGKWGSANSLPDVKAAQLVLDEQMRDGLTVPLPLPPVDLSGPVFETGDEPVQGQTIPRRAASSADLPQRATTTEAPDPIKLMKTAKKISLLMPISRDLPYATALSLLGQWKATLPEGVRELTGRIDMEPDTTCVFSRNRLATRFLENGDEWSFWMDSDMVAPIGNPAWFKRRTGFRHEDKWSSRSAMEALMSRGKSFIGAVYAERNGGGKIVASPSMHAITEADRQIAEEIKKGPSDKIIEVAWVGFGCVLVHRKVFEDMLEKLPDVRAKEPGAAHEFFTPWKGGNQGEDMSFCERAKMVGHPVFLDMAVHCSHLGRASFLP